MPSKKLARVIATGSYVPDRVLSNADLEKMVDTSDEWIFSRTGMRERRIAGENEPSSVLGIEAARRTLDRAGISAEEVDLILVATMTPDYLAPCTGALIQNALGAKNTPAMDLNAACSGYLYGLATAKAFVESGMYERVLLVATEKMSSFGDYMDRSTCVLWGDGASAALIAGEGAGIRIDTVSLGADGSLGPLLCVPAGGSAQPASQETVEQRLHFIKMQGREVYKHAVRWMEAVGRECLEQAGLVVEDVAWVVPHQANIRIMDAVAKRFHVSDDRVINTVYKYGNTSASAIGLAFDELLGSERVKSGERLLLVAFGAGLTWAGAVMTKVEE